MASCRHSKPCPPPRQERPAADEVIVPSSTRRGLWDGRWHRPIDCGECSLHPRRSPGQNIACSQRVRHRGESSQVVSPGPDGVAQRRSLTAANIIERGRLRIGQLVLERDDPARFDRPSAGHLLCCRRQLELGDQATGEPRGLTLGSGETARPCSPSTTPAQQDRSHDHEREQDQAEQPPHPGRCRIGRAARRGCCCLTRRRCT